MTGAGVIQALIGQSAGRGAVANQGQNAVFLMLQGSRPGHTQRN